MEKDNFSIKNNSNSYLLVSRQCDLLINTDHGCFLNSHFEDD